MFRLKVVSVVRPAPRLARKEAGNQTSERGSSHRPAPSRTSSHHPSRMDLSVLLWTSASPARPPRHRQRCPWETLRPRWAHRPASRPAAALSRHPAPLWRALTAQCLRLLLPRRLPSTDGKPSPRLGGARSQQALSRAPLSAGSPGVALPCTRGRQRAPWRCGRRRSTPTREPGQPPPRPPLQHPPRQRPPPPQPQPRADWVLVRSWLRQPIPSSPPLQLRLRRSASTSALPLCPFQPPCTQPWLGCRGRACRWSQRIQERYRSACSRTRVSSTSPSQTSTVRPSSPPRRSSTTSCRASMSPPCRPSGFTTCRPARRRQCQPPPSHQPCCRRLRLRLLLPQRALLA